MQSKFLIAAMAAMTLAAPSTGTVAPPTNPPAAATSPSTSRESPAASVAPARASHPLEKDDLRAWLDGLLPYALKSGDIAGALIAVVKDGNVVLEQGYGYADVAEKTPMQAQQTMVRPGSTSKLFTWTAVMQLVQQGKIDLNRDVNAYLDFKITSANGQPITMLDLMNHRAGFEEGLKDILAIDPHRLQSTEAYLKQHPRPMLFAPGEVPAYSNYGAALAGYIVQRVSGEPFASYIEHHIFQPLGMAHSTFVQPLPERFKAEMSRGYPTASLPPQPYELIIPAPAGSMATTAADMTRFMIAHLQQGRLGDFEMLDPQTARLMHSPSETAIPGFSTMAHGFFSETRNGRTLIGHGGDSVVFHTEFDLLPEEGVGIFYNFNSRGRDGAVYGLRKALLDEFMDRYFPAPAEEQRAAKLPSAAADAQRIADRYESSRRVEHGFLSIFYLLQQTLITANADGTVTTPRSLEPGDATFSEVSPDIWHENGGQRLLALRNVNGVKTVVDSEDPTSVLQAVPMRRSAPLNLTVLLGSFVILVLALIFWPVRWLVRRAYRAPGESPEVRRLRRWIAIAVAVDVVYLIAWMAVLKPVLNVELWVYSTGFDPVVRAMQVAGLLVIAAAVVGIWSLWRLSRLQPSRFAWLRHGVLCAALLGIVWIGFMGGLITFNLNY
ncbi:MAG TPA: serine hydrolase [Steroidobacteraceae bacterium]|nr:serine hydrolase [Steroidobacteraceae bacterium]